MKRKKADLDALNYTLISEGKQYYYGICEDGIVLRTQRSNFKETPAKVTVKNGIAWVCIGKTAYKLASLVAKAFIPSYRPNDIIELIDGNPRNCAVWNIRTIPRSEYNKGKTRNGLCKEIAVDGALYPSVQACARALYVDTNTLWNYLTGKYRTTMLDGRDIRLIGTEKEI